MSSSAPSRNIGLRGGFGLKGHKSIFWYTKRKKKQWHKKDNLWTRRWVRRINELRKIIRIARDKYWMNASRTRDYYISEKILLNIWQCISVPTNNVVKGKKGGEGEEG